MEDNYTYDQAALSRSEADLNADVQDPEPEYDQPPLSRIEYLLQQISGGASSGIRLKGVVTSTSALPATAENGDMYFIGPDSDGAYKEIVWLDSKGASGDWEELGYNAIDVDAFVRKAGDTMTGTLYAPNVIGRNSYGNVGNTRSFFNFVQAQEFQIPGSGPRGGLVRNSISTAVWAASGFQTLHSGGDDWDEGLSLNIQLTSDGMAIQQSTAPAFDMKFYSTETGSLVTGRGLYMYVRKNTDMTTGDVTYYCDVRTPIPEEIAITGAGLDYNSFVPKAYVDAKISREIASASSDYLPSDLNLTLLTVSPAGGGASYQKIVVDPDFTPSDPIDLVTKQYVDDSFETSLLSYIDSHIKTQAEYDALQDKTGFWFIKEATT